MKRICWVFSGILAVFFMFLGSSSSANAMEIVRQVENISSSGGLPNYLYYGVSDVWKKGLSDIPSTWVEKIQVGNKNNVVGNPALVWNDYLEVLMGVVSNGVCQSTDAETWFSTDPTFALVSANVTGQQAYNGKYCYTTVSVLFHVDKAVSAGSGYVIPLHLVTASTNTQYFHQFQVLSWAAYRPLSLTVNVQAPNVTVDNKSVVDAINATSTSQNAKLDALKSAIDSLSNLSTSGNNQAHQDAQAQLEESKKQTAAIEQTKDFVTDTSTPEAGDIASQDSLPSVGLLPAGPLDSILLLPVNILNSIIQSFGGSCQPVVAPLPFTGGEEITFPCFSETFYTGSFATVAGIVGTVASAFILYAYFKHLYKKVDRAVSLEATDEDEWGIL